MKVGAALHLVLLTAFGVWIWWQDQSWVASAGDVVPVLVGLALFYWMGGPWGLRSDRGPADRRALAIGVVALLVGSAWGLSFGMALAFAAFTWLWVGLWMQPGPSERFRLLTLVVLSFPWVLQDFSGVGWYFRLTGAAASEAVFRGLGMSVSRTGVDLVVENLSMSVEAQCAGLNSLQAMLLAGVFLACRIFPRHPAFWWMLPACVVAAWAGNTIRILLITLAALTFGPDFAMGTFHKSGGLVALLATFGLAAGGMRLLERVLTRGSEQGKVAA